MEKVLILASNAQTAEHMQHLLAGEFALTCLATEAQAMDKIEHFLSTYRQA